MCQLILTKSLIIQLHICMFENLVNYDKSKTTVIVNVPDDLFEN